MCIETDVDDVHAMRAANARNSSNDMALDETRACEHIYTPMRYSLLTRSLGEGTSPPSLPPRPAH